MKGLDKPGSRSPFATLGIVPTLDPARVKRAYFAMLAHHPPHADPQGFRAIRAAYEALQGDALRGAYLSAPMDLRAEIAGLVELRAERDHAVVQARAAERSSADIDALENILGLELEVVLRRVSG